MDKNNSENFLDFKESKGKNVVIISMVMVLIVIVFLYKRGAFSDIQSEKSNKTNAKSSTQNEKSVVNESEKDIEITKIDLNELKKDGVPFILALGSEGCAPCRAFKPTLLKMDEKYAGKFNVFYIDVWANAGSADNYPISVIPSQAFYTADGKAFQPSKAIEKELDLELTNNSDSGELEYTIHQGSFTESDLEKIIKGMGVE